MPEYVLIRNPETVEGAEVKFIGESLGLLKTRMKAGDKVYVLAYEVRQDPPVFPPTHLVEVRPEPSPTLRRELSQ